MGSLTQIECLCLSTPCSNHENLLSFSPRRRGSLGRRNFKSLFLRSLKKYLYDCRIKACEISFHIHSIYEKWIQNNSKASLIGTLTQFEYRLGLNREIHELFEQIISKIKPSFPDQNASAISRNLTKIFEESFKYKNLNSAIQDALRGWL